MLEPARAQRSIPDSMYAEIVNWKRQPTSFHRDSLILSAFFDLIPHFHPIAKENWRDSLVFYTNKFNSSFGMNLCGLMQGELLAQQGNLKKGVTQLLASSKALENSGYYAHAGFGYLRLGAVAEYMQQHGNSQINFLDYYKKGLDLSRQSKYTGYEIQSLIFIASYYLSKNKYKEVIRLCNQMLRIAATDKSKSSLKYLGSIYQHLGQSYLLLGNESLARSYFHNALRTMRSPGKTAYLNYIIHDDLARYYHRKNQLCFALSQSDSAIIALARWQSNAKLADAEKYFSRIYEIKYTIFKVLGSSDSALVYLEKLQQQREINIKEELDRQYTELHEQYSTEQNKLKVATLTNQNLQQENERRQLTFYFSIIAFTLLLGVVGLAYRSARFRQRNILTRLSLSQTQNELVKRVVDTQNAERERLAQDLHDDLGGIIATLTSRLSSLKEKVSPEFLQEELMSTQHISEKAGARLRQIAYNLMPPEFEKVGLVESLQEFTVSIDTPVFSFTVFGNERRFTSERELNTYRIATELLHNIRKHAGATHGSVQLFFHPDILTIVIGDNGKNLISENSISGVGLTSVQARTKYLDARILSDQTTEGVIQILEVPYGV